MSVIAEDCACNYCSRAWASDREISDPKPRRRTSPCRLVPEAPRAYGCQSDLAGWRAKGVAGQRTGNAEQDHTGELTARAHDHTAEL